MSRNDMLRQLAQAAMERYPAEVAERVERMRGRDVAELLARQSPPVAARVLVLLPADLAADVLEALAEPAASAILSALEPTQAASIVARLGDDAREVCLASMDTQLATELKELMAYPPGAAGTIMDPRVTGFRPDTTARDALARVRALKHRTVHVVYLVDDEGRLTGSVGVPEMALAAPGTRLDEISQPTPSVQALDPQDEVVALADEHRVPSVPVVDVGQRLIGVIRYADLLAASRRDAAADMQAMVGVSKEERALSSAFFAVRKRLPWLQINLATAFLAAGVVGLFESTIAQFTALAVLLPVVAGQSGNTGAQALAVTMRGLALREIRVRHWFRVARKELIVGAVNGVAVALVTSLGVLAWSRSPGLAVVIGGSMVLSMIIAGVSGASVPMVLIRLGQDPAAASSIVLTTITDVLGFMTFLGFATLASGML